MGSPPIRFRQDPWLLLVGLYAACLSNILVFDVLVIRAIESSTWRLVFNILFTPLQMAIVLYLVREFAVRVFETPSLSIFGLTRDENRCVPSRAST